MRHRNLDLDQLRTLVTIAKTNSFSLAASLLCKTQPAITHQMHGLEAALKCSLFRKHGRNRTLTSDGLLLVKHAEQLLSLNDEILQRFHDRDIEGTVRIGSLHEVVDTLLPPMLKLMRSSCPNVNFDVRIDRGVKLNEQLRVGEIDLAISNRYGTEFDSLVLRTSPTAWLCAADFVYRPGDVVPLVLADGPSHYRDIAIEALEKAGLRWTISRAMPDLVGIKVVMRAGFGVAPRCIDLLTPDMRVLREADGLPALPDVAYKLRIRKGNQNSLARRAFEALEETWQLQAWNPKARRSAPARQKAASPA